MLHTLKCVGGVMGSAFNGVLDHQMNHLGATARTAVTKHFLYAGLSAGVSTKVAGDERRRVIR